MDNLFHPLPVPSKQTHYPRLTEGATLLLPSTNGHWSDVPVPACSIVLSSTVVSSTVSVS